MAAGSSERVRAAEAREVVREYRRDWPRPQSSVQEDKPLTNDTGAEG